MAKKNSEKEQEKTTEKDTQISVPELHISATDPMGERMLAQYISILDDAGKTEMAKRVREAHGRFQDYHASKTKE